MVICEQIISQVYFLFVSLPFSCPLKIWSKISEDFGFVLEFLVCFHVDHAATFYKNNETGPGQKWVTNTWVQKASISIA